MKSRWDLGITLSVILLLIAYTIQQFAIENKNQKFESQKEEIQRLNQLILDNNKVPEAGVFDRQGMPKHVATRYYMVYVQLMILAEVAEVPESHLRWLRNLVKEGLLHNVLEKYTLIGIDKNNGEQKVAIKLTVDIDWETSRVYSKLKVSKEKKLDNIYNQPIVITAKTFANVVKKENLKVEMRCETVANPNLKALNTLGAPEYVNLHNKIVNLSHKKFESLVNEKLNLINKKTIKWREGNEVIFENVSDITPELKVKLKYIGRKDLENREDDGLKKTTSILKAY